MDKYRLSNDHLPSDLYRIDYPGSRTAYSPQDGFVAADTTKVYLEADEDEFKKDIVKQFTWACRDPLPFITLFSDREHAENWGFKQPWLGKMPHESRSSWSLCVIDTERLDSHCLFKLEELVASLELQLPNKAEQHINDAYLCMYSIPKTAIVEELDPDQVEISMYPEWQCK